MDNPKLNEIRKEINAIDSQLLPLLVRRMDAAGKVAEIKREAGIPVLDAQREQQILNRVRERGGAYGTALQGVYAAMMEASRALQHDALGGGQALREQVERALHAGQEWLQTPRIACSGVSGAYSDAASRLLFPEGNVVFYHEFEDVFAAVAEGKADFGVVPIENSYAGSVHEAFDLMLRYRLSISVATDLPIHHCLMALPGVQPDHLKRVYSHPQGLAQCAEYLETHGLAPIPCSNTAAAAKRLAESEEQDAAAIASADAARNFGLQILERDIQTSKNNATRFIAISREMRITPQADKISLIFTLPHTTGSLYGVLSRFARCGLNLTKIESRPIPDSNFQYYFYLDFTGSVRDEPTLHLLCALQDELPAFTFLGNYQELMGALE
ncbi:MAG: prephenate dehydratase [Clostridiales bacterium]|nr:prephenate dehydratase [Clostridiales bacterium]